MSSSCKYWDIVGHWTLALKTEYKQWKYTNFYPTVVMCDPPSVILVQGVVISRQGFSSHRIKKQNIIAKNQGYFINLNCAVNNMNKCKKPRSQTSQYRIFLTAVVVYTTSLLTILSKNMPDHLGLSIMMLWFIALLISILQQLPEELIMVCNLFSRTGRSCQWELLTGKGNGRLPVLLSQAGEDRSVTALSEHTTSTNPLNW